MIVDMKTNDAGTWPAYIETVSGTSSRKDIAKMSGVSPSAVSRWLTGITQPTDAANVAAFAIAYHRNPVEAFVAAGLLTLKDAVRGLTSDEVELLESLTGPRRRFRTVRTEKVSERALGEEVERKLADGRAAARRRRED